MDVMLLLLLALACGRTGKDTGGDDTGGSGSCEDSATWYKDADGDGYGGEVTAIGCGDVEDGWALQGGDCDDGDEGVNPGALEVCGDLVDNDCDGDTEQGGEEVCDGADNDCDGEIDEGLTLTTSYRDADEDGYGDDDGTIDACEPPPGYSVTGGDCDDTDASINPGAEEVCDGEDNNCDDVVDDGLTRETYYRDADEDGYGDPDLPVDQCEFPPGYTTDNTDCDDTDASVNPRATETCDGVDQDCDGTVDDDAADAGTWYPDADQDGYGDGGAPVLSCEQPSGHVTDTSDCDDSDPAVFPGAEEVCDGRDDDCDGAVDEDVSTSTWYADSDGDGWGDLTVTTEACSPPSGTTGFAGDCDDGDAAVNPFADETCNAIDDNCDGTVDEGC